MSNTQPPTQQISAIATTDVNGAATFNFPMAPQGYVMTGTVSIPTAGILAQVSAVLSGTIIGQWSGSNPWGPIEANPTQTLQLTATSLSPKTAYTAVWMAGTYPVSQAPGNFPGALLTTEIVAVQSFSEDLGTQTSPGPFVFSGIPPFTESILISADSASGTTTYTVVGNETGTNYFASYGIPVTSAVVGFSVVVPIVGLIDSSVTITNSSVGPITITVYALSTTPELPLPPPTSMRLTTSGAGTVFFGTAFIVALLWSWQLSAYSTAGAAVGAAGLNPIVGTGIAGSVFELTPAMATTFNVDYAEQQILQPSIAALQMEFTGVADYVFAGIMAMTLLG